MNRSRFIRANTRLHVTPKEIVTRRHVVIFWCTFLVYMAASKFLLQDSRSMKGNVILLGPLVFKKHFPQFGSLIMLSKSTSFNIIALPTVFPKSKGQSVCPIKIPTKHCMHQLLKHHWGFLSPQIRQLYCEGVQCEMRLIPKDNIPRQIVSHISVSTQSVNSSSISWYIGNLEIDLRPIAIPLPWNLQLYHLQKFFTS